MMLFIFYRVCNKLVSSLRSGERYLEADASLQWNVECYYIDKLFSSSKDSSNTWHHGCQLVSSLVSGPGLRSRRCSIPVASLLEASVAGSAVVQTVRKSESGVSDSPDFPSGDQGFPPICDKRVKNDLLNVRNPNQTVTVWRHKWHIPKVILHLSIRTVHQQASF